MQGYLENALIRELLMIGMITRMSQLEQLNQLGFNKDPNVELDLCSSTEKLTEVYSQSMSSNNQK